MQYLFLAYGNEQRLDAMSISARDAFEHACLANNEILHERGLLLAIHGGFHRSSTTTVRVHNGKLSVTDGCFSETQEQLTDIYFINARDLNEAIQVAAQMPQARGGPIEVRSLIE